MQDHCKRLGAYSAGCSIVRLTGEVATIFEDWLEKQEPLKAKTRAQSDKKLSWRETYEQSIPQSDERLRTICRS